MEYTSITIRSPNILDDSGFFIDFRIKENNPRHELNSMVLFEYTNCIANRFGKQGVSNY